MVSKPGLDGGGYPSQVLMMMGGVPHPGLDGREGGVLQPGLDDGGVPGVPPWLGLDGGEVTGVPPSSRPGWGTPPPWDGVPPHPGMGYPPPTHPLDRAA